MEYTFFDFFDPYWLFRAFLVWDESHERGITKSGRRPVEKHTYGNDDQSGDWSADRSTDYRSYPIIISNDRNGCQFCQCRTSISDPVHHRNHGCQRRYYRYSLDHLHFRIQSQHKPFCPSSHRIIYPIHFFRQ